MFLYSFVRRCYLTKILETTLVGRSGCEARAMGCTSSGVVVLEPESPEKRYAPEESDEAVAEVRAGGIGLAVAAARMHGVRLRYGSSGAARDCNLPGAHPCSPLH